MISETATELWRLANGYLTVADINTGGCERFAKAMLHYFPTGELVWTEDYVCWDHCEPWPGGHCWILYEGKHYDSCTLEGAANWFDLPYFKESVNPTTIEKCNQCSGEHSYVKVSK